MKFLRKSDYIAVITNCFGGGRLPTRIFHYMEIYVVNIDILQKICYIITNNIKWFIKI